MSSDYYTIDNPVINNNQDTQQETQSTSQQKQDATDGESPPDYAIKSQAAPVSLSVSQSIIDFGILSATNPVTRSLRLNVTAGFDGYQILASEDHPLLSASAATIPDTSCDNGSCSSLTAAPWSNTLTYGFGYRCNTISGGAGGTDCINGFEEEDNFKHFGNIGKNQPLIPIMAGANGDGAHQTEIIYKVNISGAQKPGEYNNTITYIAVPDF